MIRKSTVVRAEPAMEPEGPCQYGLVFTRVQYLLLVALVGAIALRSPFGKSLWLDEAVAVWIGRATWGEAAVRAATFQAQSPLYFLILKAWVSLCGSQEWILRVPSLLFGLGAAAFTIRTVLRLVPTSNALFLTLCLFSLEDWVRASTQARPYGLAVLGVSGSIYYLLRWLQGGHRARDAILYWAFTELAFYGHYLFGFVGIVHLSLVWLYGSTGVMKRYLPLVFLLILGAIPGLYHMWWWHHKALAALFTPLPTVGRLLFVLLPPQVWVYLPCAMMLAGLYTQAKWTRPFNRELRLAVCWIILGALSLFAVSWITGIPIFLKRYLWWRFGGTVLLAAAILRCFNDMRGRVIFIVTWALFSIVGEAARQWVIEDWQRVARAVGPADPLPILVYSGLAESESLDRLDDPEFLAYLSSPLEVYGLRPQRVNPGPGKAADPRYRSYLLGRLERMKAQQPEFALVVNSQGLVIPGVGEVDPVAEYRHFLSEQGIQCTPPFDKASEGQKLKRGDILLVADCQWGTLQKEPPTASDSTSP